MLKFFKRILQIFIGLIVVVVIAMVGVVLFVNPNQFKDTIEQQALAQTGHVLTIQGPLTWRWTPLLSLELQKVLLENTAPFKNKLLSAESIRTELGLGSILTGKIFLTLKLKGVEIILERNTKGLANWESLMHPKAQTLPTNSTPANPSLQDNKNNPSHPTKANPILLSGVSIEDGKIVFHDNEKNKHYQIDHLNLSADNIIQGALGIATPVSLNLALVNLNKQALGKLTLQADWALKQQTDELSLRNIALKFEFPNGKVTSLTGETDIHELSKTPSAQGKFESTQLDIKPWLDDLGIAYNPALPSSADIKASFSYTAPYLNISPLSINLKDNGTLAGNFKVNLTKTTPETLQLEGDFLAKTLHYGKIKFDEIKGTIAAKEGLINIPLNIQIAQSVQQAALQVDFRTKTPKYSLTQESRDFEIKHLLAMFDVKDKLEGKTNLKIKLSMTGHTPEQWRQSLSGQTDLEINEGKLYGINLISVLKNAQSGIYTLVSSLTKHQNFNIKSAMSSAQDLWKQNTVDAAAFTPFNSLKATTTINNGLIRNPDFAINHTEYTVKGAGDINLASNTIQYQTAVLLKNNPYPANDAIGNYLYSTPLPVKVDGKLSDPAIRPDLKTYTNNALVYAEKTVAKEMIQKTVQKTLQKSVEKVLDKSLDKTLEGGLDKALGGILDKVGGH